MTGGPFAPTAEIYVKASNTDANDGFGFRVALGSDLLVIGAFQEDSSATGVDGNQFDNSTIDSGAVYVLARGATWAQAAYIKASNPDLLDQFGAAVAVSADGSTIAIGAHDEDSAATGVDGDQADNTKANSGAVYVFVRSGQTWIQQAYVKASNTDAYDEFGSSVALSADGNTLVVGAPNEASSATGVGGNQADNSAVSAGAVYVFTRANTTWSQQAYVKASTTRSLLSFGQSVAISGDAKTLAVGAPGESSAATGVNGNQADTSALTSGAVYVFVYTTGWMQQAYLKASNTDKDDGFGWDVALSANGDVLIVGAPGEASAATGVDGAQNDNSAYQAGAAYAFARTGSSWAQDGYIKASNTNASDNFGTAVAVSADSTTLAVGAQFEASDATGINGNGADNSVANSGAAYVFARGAAWMQTTYVKESNTGVQDTFGFALALSGDSRTLAVGAFGEGSRATGVGGDQSDRSEDGAGAVYVFE